jgi:nucleoid-associated protein YgaU
MSSLSFDDVPRTNRTLDATQRIARVLDESGINARASLYDEALHLAKEGHLSQATERLRMLLVLDATDGDAALLLGKVLVSREQWQEALQWLDTATANGAMLPPGLREKAEASFHHAVEDAEAVRSRLAARERGELQSLRGEAKRLRSDNAALETEVLGLRSRSRLWSGAAAVLTGVCLALGVALLVLDVLSANEPEEIAPPIASVRALVEPPVVATVAPTPAPTIPAPTVATAPPAVSAQPVTPPVTVAPPVIEKPAVVHTHRVRRGDTLGRIARDYYGSSADWPKLQKANAALLGDSIDLQVGMDLVVP